MSIMSRNIAALESKYLTNITYEDIDYRGFDAPNGKLTLGNGAVMVNDLKLWIQSSKGDYYRRYNMGGYFDNALREYTLTAASAEQLKADLTNMIKSHFATIDVLLLEVVPDIVKRRWDLKLVIQDTLTGMISPVDASVSADT